MMYHIFLLPPYQLHKQPNENRSVKVLIDFIHVADQPSTWNIFPPYHSYTVNMYSCLGITT